MNPGKASVRASGHIGLAGVVDPSSLSWFCVWLPEVFNKLQTKFLFKNGMNKSYSWNMNASDEINALLNYGYSILESETRKEINAVGLDPSVGFLHELAQSKEPLVYDIQDILRWIIGISVIQLLEEKKLRKSRIYHDRELPHQAWTVSFKSID
jgi:CRISPR-associated endonuclease Cas1